MGCLSRWHVSLLDSCVARDHIVKHCLAVTKSLVLPTFTILVIASNGSPKELLVLLGQDWGYVLTELDRPGKLNAAKVGRLLTLVDACCPACVASPWPRHGHGQAMELGIPAKSKLCVAKLEKPSHANTMPKHSEAWTAQARKDCGAGRWFVSYPVTNAAVQIRDPNAI